jgi:hypothetical protein
MFLYFYDAIWLRAGYFHSGEDTLGKTADHGTQTTGSQSKITPARHVLRRLRAGRETSIRFRRCWFSRQRKLQALNAEGVGMLV